MKKYFEIQNLDQYHDFYLKSDTLLLDDVFEHFRKMWKENTQWLSVNPKTLI